MLAEDTTNTKETLSPFPDDVSETEAVELHTGHWLKSILTPCSHKQITEMSVNRNGTHRHFSPQHMHPYYMVFLLFGKLGWK